MVESAARRRVAVIGGGITGLSAAYEASRLGADVVLLEASPRLGGKVTTEVVDGFLVELGPDSFVGPKQSVLDLAGELGIGDAVVSSRPEGQGARVWWDGALHPLPEGLMLMVPAKLTPLMRSSLLSWRGKVRVFGDLFVPRGNGEDETLESFVVRRLGREVLERIAEPLIAGIHAAEPATMSLRASFPRFLEMERRHRSLIVAARRAAHRRPEGPHRSHFVSFRDGMGTLAAALSRALHDVDVRTSTSVARISVRRDGYRLLTEAGAIDADRVVLALPARTASELLEPLDSQAAASVRQIRQVSTATVTLGYRAADIPPLAGSGFVVPSSANRKVMGVSFLSNKWDGRAPDDDHVLIRAFVGGVHGRRLATASDEEILTEVERELDLMLGIRAAPTLVRVASWDGGLHQYTTGHIQRVEAAEARLAESHPGLVLAGAAFHGIGLNECVSSGRRAGRNASGHTEAARESEALSLPGS